MRGPPPTPTETLAKRGSWRAKERADEPKPEVPETCKAPDELTGRALEIWNEMAPGLHRAGLLTVADTPTFARFVRLRAAWETAMQAVEQDASRQNILALSKVDELVRKLESGFGLNPAERARLKVENPTQEDGKAKFFRKDT